jgi:hypothetical protein
MDEACFAVGLVAKERSFRGMGMSAEAGVSEDLTEVGLPAEVDNEGFFKKLWVLESG